MSNKKVIRFLYRKIVDINSTGPWEKLVFEDSYKEFLMQAQLYNKEKKHTSFAELLANSPGAYKLHFLVSASVVGYLQQLNWKVPDIREQTGRLFLPFINYRFEIINSDIVKKEQHTVAINFISEPVCWVDTIGDRLLVALGGSQPENGDELLTELVSLQPFLSIYSIKETSTSC